MYTQRELQRRRRQRRPGRRNFERLAGEPRGRLALRLPAASGAQPRRPYGSPQPSSLTSLCPSRPPPPGSGEPRVSRSRPHPASQREEAAGGSPS